MTANFLAHAGVLVDLLLASGCFVVLVLGIWIFRNPGAFWDEFNPYLRPYGRFSLGLGRLIGSLWSFGAIFGCILALGNAIRAGVHHHWLK